MDIALVGIGKIAVDQHMPAIAASPDWSLAATVSRHGSIPGIQAFSDFAQMLEARPDIRVVSLCLPPVPRFAYAQMALQAGRHVMLEKPPGATLSECHILIRSAEDMRVSLYASWHSREAAQVEPARKWLAGKRLKQVRIIWKEDVRRWHPGQSWIWEPGGMGVFDPGINALSILTAILPDPVFIKSAVLEVPENCQAPIAASLDFYHPDGAEVTAVFDFRQQGKQIWTIEIDTDQGVMQLQDGGERMLIDGQEVADDMGEGMAANGAEDGAKTEPSALSGEYPRLYAKLTRLVARGEIDMDLAPLRHVADAFTLGRRVIVAPFME